MNEIDFDADAWRQNAEEHYRRTGEYPTMVEPEHPLACPECGDTKAHIAPDNSMRCTGCGYEIEPGDVICVEYPRQKPDGTWELITKVIPYGMVMIW